MATKQSPAKLDAKRLELVYIEMKKVYAVYTGYEISDAIGRIRKEIDAEEEKIRIKEEIKRLSELDLDK
jgi:hypothetical protein